MVKHMKKNEIQEEMEVKGSTGQNAHPNAIAMK